MSALSRRAVRLAASCGLLALAAGFFALRSMRDGGGSATPVGLEPTRSPGAPRERGPQEPRPREPDAAEPQRQPRAPLPVGNGAQPTALVARARGRVIDPTGEPLASVGIGIDEDRRERALTQSDASGRFELALETLPATVQPEDPRFASVRPALALESRPERELLIVAAHRARVHGSVVDIAGAPLEGAALELHVPLGSLARIPFPLDATVERIWRTSSAADGSFAVEELPGELDGLVLEAALSGYVTARTDVSTRGRPDVELLVQLELEDVEELEVVGRVVDGGGAAVAEAVVFAGGAQAASAADGRFTLRVGRLPEGTELFAFRVGSNHARIEDFAQQVAVALDAALPRLALDDLVLDGPPLSISGRVLGADERALAGWLVYPLDCARLDPPGGYPPLSIEALVSEREFEVATDERGAFVLSGLARRSYRVEARDPTTGLKIASPPIAAGTSDLVLRVPAGALRRLAGVVRTREGMPVPQVLVQAAVPLLDAGVGAGKCANGSATTTDEDGRFTLEGVPREQAFLILRGPTIVPTFFDQLGPGDAELVVTVEALCRLQYEDIGAAPDADAIQALTEDGSVRSLTSFYPDGSSLSGERYPLTDGRAPVLAVGCDARVLVLWRGEEELRRIPLILDPGRVVVVRP